MSYYETIGSQGFYIIAEIGVNYYEIAENNNISPLNAAKLMIKKAAEAGADAVKFQTYKAENLAMVDSPGSWSREDIPIETQYELFQLYDKFGEAEYRELSEYSKECGVDFFSTPFDLDSVEYLNPLMDMYKISSSDISNIPLIISIAKKNKPIIMSTGAADYNEIEFAVDLIRQYNDKQLTLLHCVLEYPTPYEHANLQKIQSLKTEFPDMIIGYSDHTKPDEGMLTLTTAYLLGAQVIEKHFTLDKTIKLKNDHFHSMDDKDLKVFHSNLERITQLMGKGDLVCLSSEVPTKDSVRRSAVAIRDLRQGEVLGWEHIIFKRPGVGLAPKECMELIGKKLTKNVNKDQVISRDDFE